MCHLSVAVSEPACPCCLPVANRATLHLLACRGRTDSTSAMSQSCSFDPGLKTLRHSAIRSSARKLEKTHCKHQQISSETYTGKADDLLPVLLKGQSKERLDLWSSSFQTWKHMCVIKLLCTHNAVDMPNMEKS